MSCSIKNYQSKQSPTSCALYTPFHFAPPSLPLFLPPAALPSAPQGPIISKNISMYLLIC